MSLDEIREICAETAELDAESYLSLGSVALFEYAEMTVADAANDEAYENMYPFIS